MELYNNHGNGVFHAKLSNFGLNDNIVNYLVTKAKTNKRSRSRICANGGVSIPFPNQSNFRA